MIGLIAKTNSPDVLREKRDKKISDTLFAEHSIKGR
jgi:hypothetical protein